VILFWSLVAALLAAGIVWPGFVRRHPGAAVAHLAFFLVILGGAMGSAGGHAMRNRLFGSERVREGVMAIEQGSEESRILSRDGGDVGTELDFAIRCERFWLEFHPPTEERWPLGVYLTEGNETTLHPVPTDATAPVSIPGTDIRIAVLDYLAPDARPDGAALLVSTPTQARVVEIAEGSVVALTNPAGQARVTRIHGDEAVTLELHLDGEAARTVRAERADVAVQTASTQAPNLLLMFLPPRSSAPEHEWPGPLIRLVVARPQGMYMQWLAPGDSATWVDLPLIGTYADAEEWKAAGSPVLTLRRPQRVRDYKSELVVIESGREVARKTIEVNSPLHYGGYHFYQADYDQRYQSYTVLQVVSDSGLWAVYAAFALLLVGTVWQMWIAPLRRLRGRASE
jgi:ResB-like family protein